VTAFPPNWKVWGAADTALVAHMAKHMNMVRGSLWWGALGPDPLPPPKSDAGLVVKAQEAFLSMANSYNCTQSSKVTVQ